MIRINIGSATARRGMLLGVALTTSVFAGTADAQLFSGKSAGVSITAREADIYNLVGNITVTPSTGARTEVDAYFKGRQRRSLFVQGIREGDRQLITVLYPGSRIVYPGVERELTLQVTPAGAFRSPQRNSTLKTVAIGGSGQGTQAQADLRVQLPEGRRVVIYLAAGTLTAGATSHTARGERAPQPITVVNTGGTLSVQR